MAILKVLKGNHSRKTRFLFHYVTNSILFLIKEGNTKNIQTLGKIHEVQTLPTYMA